MAETARLDRIDMSVDAFGEAMPMACDETAWGRQVNRRVEVWVR
jgi:phosphate transport system substrate-binding protein